MSNMRTLVTFHSELRAFRRELEDFSLSKAVVIDENMINLFSELDTYEQIIIEKIQDLNHYGDENEPR